VESHFGLIDAAKPELKSSLQGTMIYLILGPAGRR